MLNLFQPSTTFSRQLPPRQERRQFSGEAIVDEEILPNQRGMVFFHASWWFAQCDRGVTLVPGQHVRVIGLRGTTLLVQPLTL